ncbi:MAG: cation:proton antiporter, partial [Actinomycetota bacterium]|nr:cation:proton antiporter [Actinomycetota bacterium]
MTPLEPLLLLAGAVAAASLLGKRLGVAPPVLLVLLVLGGLAVALLPGDHTIHLEPDVVLTFVIPPLLYAAAIDSSLVDVRAARWGIASLAVGLVLATAGAVALVAHLLIPDLPLSAALALGAIVGPPDAVAARALPGRVVATVAGALNVWDGAVRFLVASVGGVLVGLAVAGLVRLIRSRVDDLLVENTLSIVTPFAAYLAAEHIHASGVLAVVVTGLVLGHLSPTLVSGPSRLQTRAVWRL